MLYVIQTMSVLCGLNLNHCQANFKPPNAVRGGIPIFFPQVLNALNLPIIVSLFIKLMLMFDLVYINLYMKFGNRGSLEQNGFARNRMWVIDENPPPLHPNDSNGKAFVDLLFKPSEDDLKIWPHRYKSSNDSTLVS